MLRCPKLRDGRSYGCRYIFRARSDKGDSLEFGGPGKKSGGLFAARDEAKSEQVFEVRGAVAEVLTFYDLQEESALSSNGGENSGSLRGHHRRRICNHL